MPVATDTDLTTLTLLLARVGRLSESLALDVCAARGTTPAEFRVLALLRHRPGGAGSPSDIARWVVQTSGGLTATLRRLEADGHVERRPDPDDGRGRLVALTDRGRAFHDELLDELVERHRPAVADLGLDVTLHTVRGLVAGLERANGLPASDGFVAGHVLPPTA